MVRIGSLFSGAGGLDMAVEAAFGGHTVWHCELDKAASKVLAHRWPGVPNLGDITAVDWSAVEPIDVLCGGFPCQDVSSAGRRAGIKDGTRSGLWSIFAEAIAALRPSIVIIENVRGLLNAEAHRAMESAADAVGDGSGRPILRAAGAVLGDLADLGYDAQWLTLAASTVGAPHRRERVFILAIAADSSRGARGDAQQQHLSPIRAARRGDAADAAGDRRHQGRPESARLERGSDAAVSGHGSVELLPTPRSRDHKGATASRAGDGYDLPSALLPTPSVADSTGGHMTRGGDRSNEKLLPGIVRDLLPTPCLSDLKTPQHVDKRLASAHQINLADAAITASQWGKYGPVIERWENLTRPAPAPTEPNKNGNPRLSAAFSEWLMGWPAGWVTDPAIGITRNDALRIVGNGVCPQQAHAAIRWLLSVSEVAA